MRRVALVLVVFAALTGTAQAARVAVVVVPPDDPFPTQGAIGLLVPGEGETTSREAALASLLRGKVKPSVLGGVPSGKPLISLSDRPSDVTIYVSLPEGGRQPNTKRYGVAIVGGGYTGVLTSPSTRVRGLVSIADIAPTALALERGDKPRIRSSPDADPLGAVAQLDRRLDRAHDVRLWATWIIVLVTLGGALIAFAYRTELTGRMGVAAAPAVLGVALLLSAVGASHVALLLAVGSIAAAVAVAVPPRLLPWALLGLIVAYLVVLAGWPEVNSFAAIGARPDGGGRFYGAPNLVETVLLTISLEAAYLLGPRWIPVIGGLTLLTLGWSRAGADGGGVVVILAAFATLAARVYGWRITWRRVVLGGVGVAVVVAALVGLDAATGGSSHVTHAFRRGPVSLVGDLFHRIHLSAAQIGASWDEAVVFGVSVAALVILATRPPRFPAGDALLVGIAVSLLVNDSPGDIASAGALSYSVLWTYERARSVDSRAWVAKPFS